MKYLSWLIVLPLALLTIFLAVANRHRVALNLDPFNPDAPALALETPLIFLLLAAVFLGIVIGATAAWTGQGRHRKAARQAKGQLATLQQVAPAKTSETQISGPGT